MNESSRQQNCSVPQQQLNITGKQVSAVTAELLLLLLQNQLNGLFSMTSWYQKGKTSLDLNEARNDGVLGTQWHQLDHMQTICITPNTTHTNTPLLNFTGRMLFLTPNQWRQSTEDTHMYLQDKIML